MRVDGPSTIKQCYAMRAIAKDFLGGKIGRIVYRVGSECNWMAVGSFRHPHRMICGSQVQFSMAEGQRLHDPHPKFPRRPPL